MAFLDQDFKNLSLREIRFHRDRIQQFLENTYTIAENAVDNLFTNKNDPDFLKKLDEMNTLLKDCREKLITVANSLPHKGSISSLQNTQVRTVKTIVFPRNTDLTNLHRFCQNALKSCKSQK